MVLPFVFSVSLVAAAVAYFMSPNDQDRAVCELPTPRSTLPLIKNTLDLTIKQRVRIYDWILEQCREHGGQPWRVRVLGRPPAVVISSPEGMEDILKTQFEVFVKGSAVATISHDLLGDGIFTVDGSKWKYQRKIASHFFSMNMIRDAMEHVVRDHNKLLISKLKEAAENRETLDIKRVFDFFTMDIFTKIGFGVELHGLETGGNCEFIEAFERASRRIMARFQQPMCVWKLARWLNIGAEKQMADDMSLINGVVYDVIRRNLEKKNASNDSKDLISLFLEKVNAEYSEVDHTVVTPTMLRDMSMVFTFAGRDSTSLTMTWFIIEMNRHPEALAKVQRELTQKLPRLQVGSETPNMEDIDMLVYLEAAICECIRLNPVAPAMQRIAAQDTTLYNGTFIKAGTRIILPHYAMGHLETVWGPDAEEYKPERWIDPDTGKLLHISPYKFTAFLAGPRMCLGMRFALAEMKITLATILSKFDIHTVKNPLDFTDEGEMKLEAMTTWVSPASVAVSCVALVVVYFATPSARDRALKHLPTPEGDYPILRHTIEIVKAQKSGEFHDWVLYYCRKYQGKPWSLRMVGRNPSVMICCPEAFEDVLKTQFDAFDKSPFISEAMYDVLGQGIFVISGPLWQHQRKTASHLFTAQMMHYAMEVVVPEMGEELVKRLNMMREVSEKLPQG
ncbi:Cytochrome p450 [Phytophthora palmivora]|uniref:Cytochrome p450 n=1 Tax=Phytophthora palmivora TaxID=4796 RepID=A0A2P4YQH9_9STRA|nr:Cytochrome p450 [Phytophthora palmivora]